MFRTRHANRPRRRNAPLALQPLDERLAPAVFTVSTTADVVDPTDGKLSLREAVTRANERPGADTIVLPAGTFKITRGAAGEDANAGGDFDITDSLYVVGHGAIRTVVNGNELDRVFHVLGNAPSAIRVHFRGLTIAGGAQAFDGGGILMGNADVTLTSCNVTGNAAAWSGGGISNYSYPASGNLRLISSTVWYNTSIGGDGGGIYLDGGTLTGLKTTITGNVAKSSGGGIAGTLVNLNSCTISWNTATDLWAGGVGGTTMNLANTTVNDNRAGGAGGGVYSGNGDISLTRSTLTRNVAGGDGGGVYALNGLIRAAGSTFRTNLAGRDGGGLSSFKDVTLNRCTVIGNSASRDGGGVNAYGSAVLNDSTITANSAGSEGGGVSSANDATLTTCIVSGNSAKEGGGISVETATLRKCTFANNSATEYGGGISATDATVEDTTIQSNSGIRGGGIKVSNKVSLASSTISDNSAQLEGGGIWSFDDAVLNNCNLSNNHAGRLGGGMLASSADLYDSTVSGNFAGAFGGGVWTNIATLNGSTISSNSSGDEGGGIFAAGLDLTNCTVSGNRAVTAGGGLRFQSGSLLNVTITQNIAAAGGGVSSGASPTVTVKNSLIAGNICGSSGSSADVYGVFDSLGHNLIGIEEGSLGFDHQDDLTGNLYRPIDPKLGELKDNGGPTKTHALLRGSWAIDQGDSSNAPLTDQRGISRLDGDRDGTRNVDIGAFEYQGPRSIIIV